VKNIILLGALALMACNSCVPTPAPAPTPVPTVSVPDAGPPPAMGGAAPIADAGPEPIIDLSVRRACERASALGCSEARDLALCERVTQRAFTEQLIIVPLACMVGATSKADMQRCGFIGCP
jgi:hypothetical protein